MKKVFTAGMLAICLIALSQQQASAWINTRFGIGLNWEYQSGGNNFGWGAYRNGQPPGPEAFQSGPLQSQPFPVYGNYHSHGHSHAQTVTEMPAYAQPNIQPSVYQFATYPRPVYYYPAPSYYGR